MMPESARLLVFDSGVGGLAIYQELCGLLPAMDSLYCLDNAYYPYGTKADAEIIDRVVKLLPQLVERYAASILVVACNTASTLALAQIRKSLAIPVVGVVPAIKVAAQMTQTKVIGLLATEATVRRSYTEQLIRDFAASCEIIKLGSRKLVDLAEAKVRGNPLDSSEILQELAPFFKNEAIDTVILACTHFDHLQSEFARLAPRPITWVSSAHAVALHTQRLVAEQALKNCVLPRRLLVGTQVIEPGLCDALRRDYGFQAWETFCV